MESKDSTGSAAQETGSGEGQRHERPGSKGPLATSDHPPSESGESGAASNQQSSGSQAGSKQSDQSGGSRGSGQPNTGGRPGYSAKATVPSNAKDRGEDAANLDFTRKQVDLALEHLKDQLAKEKPDLLKKLGWNRDDARRFMEAWRKRVAGRPGVRSGGRSRPAVGSRSPQETSASVPTAPA